MPRGLCPSEGGQSPLTARCPPRLPETDCLSPRNPSTPSGAVKAVSPGPGAPRAPDSRGSVSGGLSRCGDLPQCLGLPVPGRRGPIPVVNRLPQNTRGPARSRSSHPALPAAGKHPPLFMTGLARRSPGPTIGRPRLLSAREAAASLPPSLSCSSRRRGGAGSQAGAGTRGSPVPREAPPGRVRHAQPAGGGRPSHTDIFPPAPPTRFPARISLCPPSPPHPAHHPCHAAAHLPSTPVPIFTNLLSCPMSAPPAVPHLSRFLSHPIFYPLRLFVLCSLSNLALTHVFLPGYYFRRQHLAWLYGSKIHSR